MQTFTIVYTVKYVLDFASNYVWTKDDLCFNLKTNRRIKQVYKSGSIGYYINSKFYSIKFLRKHLIKPKQEYCPF